MTVVKLKHLSYLQCKSFILFLIITIHCLKIFGLNLVSWLPYLYIYGQQFSNAYLKLQMWIFLDQFIEVPNACDTKATNELFTSQRTKYAYI